MSLDQKIIIAVAELLKGGEKVTGYSIAKKAGVERQVIYRKLKKILQN